MIDHGARSPNLFLASTPWPAEGASGSVLDLHEDAQPGYGACTTVFPMHSNGRIRIFSKFYQKLEEKSNRSVEIFHFPCLAPA